MHVPDCSAAAARIGMLETPGEPENIVSDTGPETGDITVCVISADM